MTTDDAKPLIRTLRDVLMDARSRVADSRDWSHSVGDRMATRSGDALLERIDGAIAEADEVLS